MEDNIISMDNSPQYELNDLLAIFEENLKAKVNDIPSLIQLENELSQEAISISGYIKDIEDACAEAKSGIITKTEADKIADSRLIIIKEKMSKIGIVDNDLAIDKITDTDLDVLKEYIVMSKDIIERRKHFLQNNPGDIEPAMESYSSVLLNSTLAKSAKWNYEKAKRLYKEKDFVGAEDALNTAIDEYSECLEDVRSRVKFHKEKTRFTTKKGLTAESERLVTDSPLGTVMDVFEKKIEECHTLQVKWNNRAGKVSNYKKDIVRKSAATEAVDFDDEEFDIDLPGFTNSTVATEGATFDSMAINGKVKKLAEAFSSDVATVKEKYANDDRAMAKAIIPVLQKYKAEINKLRNELKDIDHTILSTIMGKILGHSKATIGGVIIAVNTTLSKKAMKAAETPEEQNKIKANLKKSNALLGVGTLIANNRENKKDAYNKRIVRRDDEKASGNTMYNKAMANVVKLSQAIDYQIKLASIIANSSGNSSSSSNDDEAATESMANVKIEGFNKKVEGYMLKADMDLKNIKKKYKGDPLGEAKASLPIMEANKKIIEEGIAYISSIPQTEWDKFFSNVGFGRVLKYGAMIFNPAKLVRNTAIALVSDTGNRTKSFDYKDAKRDLDMRGIKRKGSKRYMIIRSRMEKALDDMTVRIMETKNYIKEAEKNKPATESVNSIDSLIEMLDNI